METLQKPEMILGIINSLAILSSSAYLFQQVQSIKAQVETISKQVESMTDQVTKNVDGSTAIKDHVKKLTDELNNIQERTMTEKEETEEQLKKILEALEENDIEVDSRKKQRKQRLKTRNDDASLLKAANDELKN